MGLAMYCDVSYGFSKVNLNVQFGGFAAECIYMKYGFTLSDLFYFVQAELLDWPQLQVGTA